MENSKVLITGGCGFIGRHLCRKLVESGKNVVVLDIAAPQNGGTDGCEMVRGDICDSDLVRRLMQNVNTVYHLAAVTTFEECRSNPKKALRINVWGTSTVLLEAARSNVGSFVFLSSASVYSGNKEPVKHEKMILEPQSAYGLTKLMGEELCWEANEAYGLPCVALRLFNVYGEGGRGVINKFADSVKERRCIAIRDDGNQTRDYIHVDDVVKATIAIGEERLSGAYNIGTGRGCSLLELKRIMEQISGITLTVKRQPREPWDLQELIADTEKVKRLLPTTIPLAEGLAALLRMCKTKR